MSSQPFYAWLLSLTSPILPIHTGYLIGSKAAGKVKRQPAGHTRGVRLRFMADWASRVKNTGPQALSRQGPEVVRGRTTYEERAGALFVERASPLASRSHL